MINNDSKASKLFAKRGKTGLKAPFWRILGGTDGHAFHRAFASKAIAYGAPQGPFWARTWGEMHGCPIFYAVLYDQKQPRLSLPLQVSRRRGIEVAHFPGGSHANGSFPALAEGGCGDIDPATLAEALRANGHRVDALLLERMQPQMSGRSNPLLPFATNQSVDPDLAADVEGGWDAWMKRNAGKKKRKKHRQDHDAFATIGPVKVEVVQGAPQIAEALNNFYAMKARRFEQLGVKDVFAEPRIQSFFQRLALKEVALDHPCFDVTVLSVNDRPIAIAGHSLLPDRMVCEFSAFEPIETEVRSVSPSLYMHHESIQRAAEAGYRYYDFSVGDEFYKHHWCDTRTELFDIALGITITGRAHAFAHRAAAKAKRKVKSNASAMKIIRRIRPGR
ncbi:GNAT family N-acetyltransferase [Notoacmeibacter ruber]|uniref:GNAT family N-acetyltransferase n=1 Tax=Notoacmeibacter ruber TaxID=2670375 RepID=A0A3L7J9B5_9HYPH|nr:GNAT family N-acetyltransferase [Notoacmeibacter ruber]RLQ87327.1 GNAT family N-acetyltransferase [Notoacmeibacter ruber]